MGAIALVLFLVIVPPMVMDLEPKPVTTDLTVEIPRQERARLTVPPPPPQSAPAAPGPVEPRNGGAEQAAAAAKAGERARGEARKAVDAKAGAEDKNPAKAAAATERKGHETARAEAILEGKAPPEGATFVVPLGAYANPDNVKQLQAKLARAGVKSFTEPVKSGATAQTRVAAGPYASRAEAERARDRLAALKDLGVVPGTVTTR